jgi:hypothetical protein
VKLIPLILLPVALLAFDVQGAKSGNPNRYGAMAESMMDMMDTFSSAYQKRSNAAGKQPQGNMPWTQGMPSWSPGSMPMQMGTLGMMSSMPMGWGSTPWSQGSMPSWPKNSMPSWPQGSMPSWQQGSMPSWPQKYMPWSQSPPWSDSSYGQEYGRPSHPQGANDPVAELDGSWQGKSGELLVIRHGRFRIYQDQERFREGNLALEGQNTLTMQDPSTGNAQRYDYALHEGKLALRNQAGNLFLYRRIQ